MRVVIRIDPTRCRGHGICALLFSDAIELDHWGFGRPRDAELEGRRRIRQARRAARACPNRAISFDLVHNEPSTTLQPG